MEGSMRAFGNLTNGTISGAPRVLGIWGEGLFIFRELGSTAYFLGELGSKHILLGIKGALPKSKNK